MKLRYKMLTSPLPVVKPEALMWGDTVDGIQCALKSVLPGYTPGEERVNGP